MIDLAKTELQAIDLSFIGLSKCELFVFTVPGMDVSTTNLHAVESSFPLSQDCRFEVLSDTFCVQLLSTLLSVSLAPGFKNMLSVLDCEDTP